MEEVFQSQDIKAVRSKTEIILSQNLVSTLQVLFLKKLIYINVPTSFRLIRFFSQLSRASLLLRVYWYLHIHVLFLISYLFMQSLQITLKLKGMQNSLVST